MKNKLLKDHFLNPRNIGNIANAKFKSVVKSDVCNDIVKMMAEIDSDGIIKDIKVEVYGCGYSISGSSLLTELLIGKSINDIENISKNNIENKISDIPERHKSCVLLSKKALLEITEKFKSGK